MLEYPAFICIYTLSLSDLIQNDGFKYYLYESNFQNFTCTFHLFSEYQTITCKVFWASPHGCLIEISHLTCPKENSHFVLQLLFFSSRLIHLSKWHEPPTKASSHLWSLSFLYLWHSNLKEVLMSLLPESILNPPTAPQLHYWKPCPTSVWSSLPSGFCPFLLSYHSVVRAVNFWKRKPYKTQLINILQWDPNAQEWIFKLFTLLLLIKFYKS